MNFEYKKNGNMLVESNYELFNKQSNYLGTGNVIANTQVSWYIRPSYKVDSNSKLGELQDYDLDHFKQMNKWNKQSVKDFVDKNNGGILYWFFYVSNKKIVTIGYLLTNKEKTDYIALFSDTNRLKKKEFFDYIALYYIVKTKKYIVDDVIKDKERLINQYCSSNDSIASFNKSILTQDIQILERYKKDGNNHYVLTEFEENHTLKNKVIFKKYSN